jgi:hypothetical protein
MPIITSNPQQSQQSQQDAELPVGRRQKGTGFTNIGRILGANIGAGEQMGQQVGRSLGLQAGQVRAGAERSAQQFRTQAEEARAKALQDISGVGQYLGAPVTSVSELTEEQAKTAGEKLRGAKYAGPTQMTGAESLGKKAGTLGQAAIYGYGGPGGQRQLLRQSVAAPGTYTAGQSVLDQILLGQSAAGQKAVRGGAQEALGTKQAVGGLLGTTAQTAKDISSEVGKEKERVSKGALEELSNIQETGEEQAQQFYSDAARLQELMLKAGQKDFEGKPMLDPSSLTPEDLDLINRAGEFGVPVSDIFVDPRERYADLSKNILATIAGQGKTAYTGGVKLDASQLSALKNLGLITGQEPTYKESIDTNIFPSERSAAGGAISALTDAQEKAFNELKLREAINLNYYGSNRPEDASISDAEYQRIISDPRKNVNIIPQLKNYDWLKEQIEAGNKNIALPLGNNRYFTTGDLSLLRPSLAISEKNLQQEKLAQTSTTLGDYLKRLYGQN